MHKHTVLPAVLEYTVARARARISSLAILKAPLHLDLMDGIFVRTHSISARSLALLNVPRGTTAHLMVQHPDRLASACWNAGIRSLVLHVESSITPLLVRELRRFFTITLAVNPGTPLSKLTPYRRSISRFHVLLVHPGRQGALFLKTQLRVVRSLRRAYPRATISVDGGMTERTIPLAVSAGADTVIVGSALKQQRDLRSRFRSLRAAAE